MKRQLSPTHLIATLGVLLVVGTAYVTSTIAATSSVSPKKAVVVVKKPVPKKAAPVVKKLVKKPAPKKAVVTKSTLKVPTTPKPEVQTIIIIPPNPKLSPAPLVITPPSTTPSSTPQITPPPSQEGTLTHDGVVAWTNIQRKNTENLPALQTNQKLDAIADLRLKDMFAKQYFEHVAPDGSSATTIAKDVGYSMILLGENIALGDFGTDKKIVQAWMDSPHHRENILNTRYSEIGIAVGKSTYKGHDTWIGVQIFGLPLSACTSPDVNMKNAMDQTKTQIDSEQSTLAQKKAVLEARHPQTQAEVNSYNILVGEYNNLAAHINLLATKLKEIVVAYNSGVRAFNACVHGQ